MTKAQLRLLLDGLEKVADHDLDAEEWADLLRAAYPSEFPDLPLPPRPAEALSSDARIAVYAARVEAGLHLYHPGDLWRRTAALRVGVEVERIRNGSDSERGIV